MSKSFDAPLAVILLSQLLKGTYYEADIASIIPGTAPIIRHNKDLHQLFATLFKQPHIVQTKTVRWSDLTTAQRTTIHEFFEYLYFTSPAFLSSAS